MIILKDIFIGNFPLTQNFGERPEVYKQFDLNGHDGLDYGTPADTQIVSATNGEVIVAGYDANGYGNYCKVLDWDQLCVCVYAHFKNLVIKQGDKIVCGELLGYADSTGFSTGNHLHFAVAKVDSNGMRINRDNGFQGYLNPLDGRIFEWKIKNLTQPVTNTSGTESEVEKLQKEYDTCRVARDSHWNDLQAKIKELGDLNTKYNLLIGEKQKLEEEHRTLLTDFSHLQDESAKQITSLTTQVNDLTVKSEELKATIVTLESTLTQTDDEKLKKIKELEIITGGQEERIKVLQTELNKLRYTTIIELKRWKIAVIKKF